MGDGFTGLGGGHGGGIEVCRDRRRRQRRRRGLTSQPGPGGGGAEGKAGREGGRRGRVGDVRVRREGSREGGGDSLPASVQSRRQIAATEQGTFFFYFAVCTFGIERDHFVIMSVNELYLRIPPKFHVG